MSSAMDVHEQIRIRSGSAQAKALIEALKQYIQQINHMTCLEYIQNLRLTLSDGSDTVVCEAEIETEPGNTWVLTPDGMRQRQADHVIWQPDHPLMKMLSSLDTAKEITFEWSASLMQLVGADYGSAYWQKRIAETGPETSVSYRALETNDFDACARTVCKREESDAAAVPRNQPLKAVEDIQHWFCGNFGFRISDVKESDWNAFGESVEAAHAYFAESFADCPDLDLDLDLSDGEAEVSGSLSITMEQTDGLITAMQRFADIAGQFDARVEMEMDFEPDEVKENGFPPFAVVCLKCVDGKVILSACRFDE